MLSSNSHIRLRPLVLVFLLLGFVAGCGFRPLYGRHEDNYGNAVSDQLALVRITPIGDRAGLLLRNHLFDRMTPRGSPSAPLYELEVTLSNASQSVILRKDATATRANLTLSASFNLTTLGSGTPVTVMSDMARSVVSYDILDAQFATVSAEKNAQERAVHELASDIVNRLAVYFSNPAADRASKVPALP